MQPHERNQTWAEPNRTRDPRMSAFAQAQAYEQMLQAKALGEITLAAVARVRRILNSVGAAMMLAYGRR
jgi:hypothetical protein